LLKGWEGVGEMVDGKEQASEYSPEKAAALLKQNPELYWQVLGTAGDIAAGKEQQEKETVKKSPKRSTGSTNSAASRAKKQSGNAKS
jgi:hypothetical protein